MKEIKNISFRQFYFFYLKKKKKRVLPFFIDLPKKRNIQLPQCVFYGSRSTGCEKKNNNNVFGGVCMLFLVDGSVSMRVKLSD